VWFCLDCGSLWHTKATYAGNCEVVWMWEEITMEQARALGQDT
jgi:hypothetical protein